MSIYNVGYMTDADLAGLPKTYAYPDGTTMTITCQPILNRLSSPVVTGTAVKTVTFNGHGAVLTESRWVVTA